MDSMSKLSDAFNTGNEGTSMSAAEENFGLDHIKQEIAEIESRKGQLVDQNKKFVIKDQKFLDMEIKSLILCSRTVLKRLEQDIQVGAEPRKYEVFAQLANSVTAQYKELMELNRMIIDLDVKSNEMDYDKMGKKKISMTADQLLEMVEKASEKSQMKEIDATFEVGDS